MPASKIKNPPIIQYYLFILLIGVIILMSSGIKTVFAQNTQNIPVERIVNVRFGFAFFHPKDWIKREPDNGDGFSFTNPKNQQVKITGSGMYYMAGIHPIVLNNGSFTLDEYLEKYYDVGKKDLLYDQVSPCDAEEWNKETKTASLTKAFARRVSFKQDGYTTVLFVAIHDERMITIQCMAPDKDFEAYKDYFAAATENVKILPRPVVADD